MLATSLKMSVLQNNLDSKTVEELTELVSDKKALVAQLAEKHDKAPMTIRNHWLNGYYSVPKVLVTEVKADLIAFIINENTEKE